MKYAYAMVAGLALVALAAAPAMAGGDKAKKTTDTQQVPSAGSSVTAEPKTDVSPSVNTGSGNQTTQGSTTTDSPSASPSTQGTDTSVNPSKPADAPADTSESKEKKY